MGLLLLVLSDIAGLLASYQLSYLLRIDVLPKYLAFPEPLPLMLVNPVWLPVVFVFFFWYENLYAKRLPFWEEVKQIWKACVLAFAAALTVITLGKLMNSVSRTVIVFTLVNSLWILPVFRYYGKRLIFALGLFKRRVLILGAGLTGELLVKSFISEKNMGYEIIGFLDDDRKKMGKEFMGAKVLGRLVDIEKFLKPNVEVIVAIPSLKAEKVVGLVNSLQKKVRRVSFIPDLFGIPFFESDMDFHFESQILILNVRNNLKNALNMFVKRVFDIIVSIPVFLILLPFILLIAVIIKLNSKGPAFWVEERIGRNGKLFKCVKFRSMYINADEILKKALSRNKKLADEWKLYFKLKNDPRTTGVGKFIRKYSLDELPQIINIVKGDMSLVGPRPYLPREQKDMGNYYYTITEVNPGLTGLWQVSGRNKKSFSERLVLDAWYIQNWSLWLDIVIIIRTFRVVLKREGAY